LIRTALRIRNQLLDITELRIRQPVSLDPTFSDDGIVITDFGRDDSASEVFVLADGKILVVGENPSKAAFARYNSDGSLDETFGNIVVDYTVAGPAVVMDTDVSVYDPYFSSYTMSYHYATLRLSRHGGANADDLFSGAGITAGQASGNVIVFGQVIGTYTYGGGIATITFNGLATQSRVDKALQSLAYSNSSNNPPTQVQIDWIFSDNNTGEQGSGGSLSATASIFVEVAGPNQTIVGTIANELFSGGNGSDTIDGGAGFDTSTYSLAIANYKVSKTGSGFIVTDKTSTDGTDTLSNIEQLKFTDMTVNLTIQSLASSAPQADVQRLEELYVAFFNRVPDADGLAYWIGQMNAGQSINQIAESFYNAGIQYSDLTGFSSTMSNNDFVNVVYRNVLGRSEGADSEGLAYWSNALGNQSETHGSLVSTIIGTAHTFKGNATWGWVADLLDNKIAVAKTFAVDLGLTYNTPNDSISKGMAIAAAVTPTSTADAIALIGVSTSDIQLV
jgi:hypothetical protein